MRRIEWRSHLDDGDNLLLVGAEPGGVERVWPADNDRIADFLNDMSLISKGDGQPADEGKMDPEGWGEVIAVRSESGDVLFIEPELFWNSIADRFRSRGQDPHTWKGRRG